MRKFTTKCIVLGHKDLSENDKYVFDVDNNINETIGNLIIPVKKFLSEAEKVGFGKISTNNSLFPLM